ALRDKDASKRRNAASTLHYANLDDPEDKSVLLALLSVLGGSLADQEQEVRVEAADALGHAGPDAKAAVPLLIKAMKDMSPQVRGAAAGALGEIGPNAKDAIPVLMAALGDRDKAREITIGTRTDAVEVRMEAAQALGRIGPAARASIPTIIGMLKEK